MPIRLGASHLKRIPADGSLSFEDARQSGRRSMPSRQTVPRITGLCRRVLRQYEQRARRCPLRLQSEPDSRRTGLHQRLIRLAGLRVESRHAAAEIGTVKFRVRVDFAGQETRAELAERNEADAKLLRRAASSAASSWQRCFAKLASKLFFTLSFQLSQAAASRCPIMRTNSRARSAQVAISGDRRHSSAM